MMELKDLFEQAVANSRTLPETPGNDVLLKLYALYKQSTIGDVTTDGPVDPFNFIAKVKHSAWSGLKGKTKEAAMQEYADLVAQLKG